MNEPKYHYDLFNLAQLPYTVLMLASSSTLKQLFKNKYK